MNRAEIANLFVRAAFIDSRLPIDARPKRLKGAWFTGAALTVEDQRKWLIREEGDKPSQIHKLDKGPMHDWWMAFWDGKSVDTSRNDVRLWELANELVTLVADEGIAARCGRGPCPRPGRWRFTKTRRGRRASLET